MKSFSKTTTHRAQQVVIVGRMLIDGHTRLFVGFVMFLAKQFFNTIAGGKHDAGRHTSIQ